MHFSDVGNDEMRVLRGASVVLQVAISKWLEGGCPKEGSLLLPLNAPPRPLVCLLCWEHVILGYAYHGNGRWNWRSLQDYAFVGAGQGMSSGHGAKQAFRECIFSGYTAYQHLLSH